MLGKIWKFLSGDQSEDLTEIPTLAVSHDEMSKLQQYLRKQQVELRHASLEKMVIMIRGRRKIEAIKLMREEVARLGLKEAKDFVDTLETLMKKV